MFEDEGYDVITARNGEEAIEKAYSDKPDLIILDMVLPGKNGKEVLAELKNDASCAKLPVILITAQTQKSYVASLRDSGADFYMTKPFDIYELRDKVKELLSDGKK